MYCFDQFLQFVMSTEPFAPPEEILSCCRFTSTSCRWHSGLFGGKITLISLDNIDLRYNS